MHVKGGWMEIPLLCKMMAESWKKLVYEVVKIVIVFKGKIW